MALTARPQSLAGEGSALHKKYGAYMQHIGIVNVPDNYNDRMTLMIVSPDEGHG
jgi:hypothetical protein